MDQPEPRTAEFQRLYNHALELAEAGKSDESSNAFRKAATFAPELWCELATQYAKDGEEDMAVEFYRIALQVTKHAGIRSGVFNNLGLLLAGRGQMQEALASFQQARDLSPQSADAYSNIALVHKWAGRLEEANRWITRALTINPWHNEAQFIQALISLLSGNYLTGFRQYECRWRSKTNNLLKLETNTPEWPGPTDPRWKGKRIFVYGEQGAGDVFLMLRYAKLLHEFGMKQIWIVKKGMKSLVETMGCIDEIDEGGNMIPQFDCHIPAASLPRVFGTTMENVPNKPYIPMPLEILCHCETPLQVGICWRGSSAQNNDRFRSTNLEYWQPVLDLPGIEFHSLQVDGADEALAYPQIIPHDPPKDWMETARRIASMDLVISVDTSLVHLAGAMGKPCWCALHCRPYFVYPLVTDQCPWYPSVKLFKQTKEHEWKPVFQRIATELQNLSAIQPSCLADGVGLSA